MKPRGRPRLAAPDASVNVHFRLSAKQYDLMQKHATAARLSLAEYLRRRVARPVKDKDM